MRPFVAGTALSLRSQDLPAAYVINGAFYLTTPASLRTLRSFHGEEAVPLVMERPEESIDIDTEWDFRLAEAIETLAGARPA